MNNMINKNKPKLVPISRLKPYSKNVKEHPPEQINDLKRMMADKKIGYTYPIIIDEKNQILAGHGRVQAMTELGEKTIPAITLYNLTKSEKHKIVLRDNLLAESHWIQQNVEILLSEMKPIDIEPFEMNLDDFKIPVDSDSKPQQAIEDEIVIGEKFRINFEFTSITEYETILQKLKSLDINKETALLKLVESHED